MLNLINVALGINGYFAITGRRMNVDVTQRGYSLISDFQHWGTDYYIYRLPTPLCIKPYLIGRFFWDSHILSNLVHLTKTHSVLLIDASDYYLPAHTNHVYNWGPSGNNTTKVNLVNPLVFYNLRLTSLFEYHSIQSFPLKVVSTEYGLLFAKSTNLNRALKNNKYKVLYILNYLRLYLANLVMTIFKK